jgi:hypothetical protein
MEHDDLLTSLHRHSTGPNLTAEKFNPWLQEAFIFHIIENYLSKNSFRKFPGLLRNLRKELANKK